MLHTGSTDVKPKHRPDVIILEPIPLGASSIPNRLSAATSSNRRVLYFQGGYIKIIPRIYSPGLGDHSLSLADDYHFQASLD